MKRVIPLFVLLIALNACKTNLVYISVLVPAPVTVPGDIKKAGIINRSIPGEDTKALNTMHHVLTGQSLAILREGSAEAVRGLKDALTENKRFVEVNVLENIKMNSPGAGIFPSPISWDEIIAVCRASHTDVVFVLELFDTELKINPSSAPDLSSANNAINSVLNTEVSFTTSVKTGWRIYNPRSKSILDEDSFNQRFNFTGNAITAAQTAEVLIGRKETIKKTANNIGRDYAAQILLSVLISAMVALIRRFL